MSSLHRSLLKERLYQILFWNLKGWTFTALQDIIYWNHLILWFDPVICNVSDVRRLYLWRYEKQERNNLNIFTVKFCQGVYFNLRIVFVHIYEEIYSWLKYEWCRYTWALKREVLNKITTFSRYYTRTPISFNYTGSKMPQDIQH